MLGRTYIHRGMQNADGVNVRSLLVLMLLCGTDLGTGQGGGCIYTQDDMSHGAAKKTRENLRQGPRKRTQTHGGLLREMRDRQAGQRSAVSPRFMERVSLFHDIPDLHERATRRP